MKKKAIPQSKKISVRIYPLAYKALKRIAKREKLSLSTAVRIAIYDFIIE